MNSMFQKMRLVRKGSVYNVTEMRMFHVQGIPFRVFLISFSVGIFFFLERLEVMDGHLMHSLFHR